MPGGAAEAATGCEVEGFTCTGVLLLLPCSTVAAAVIPSKDVGTAEAWHAGMLTSAGVYAG